MLIFEKNGKDIEIEIESDYYNRHELVDAINGGIELNNITINLINDLKKNATAKNKNACLKYFIPWYFVKLYNSFVEK